MVYFISVLGIMLLLKLIISDYFKKANEEFISQLKSKNIKAYKLIRALDRKNEILKKSFDKNFIKLSKLFVICLFFNFVIFRLLLPQVFFNFKMGFEMGFLIIMLSFTCFKLFYDFGLFEFYNFKSKEKVVEVVLENLEDEVEIYKEMDIGYWGESPITKLFDLLNDNKINQLAIKGDRILELLLQLNISIKKNNLLFISEKEKEILENEINELEEEIKFHKKNKMIKSNIYLIED